MELAQMLIDHAAIVVVAGPLVGLDGICVVGGIAAAAGVQPPIVMLLLAFQGQVLAELLTLTSGGRRWSAGLVCGARWSRRLGVTRTVLASGEAGQRWLLTIYGLLGAAVLASMFVVGGYLVATLLMAIGVQVVPLSPLIATISIATLLWLFGRRRHRRRGN